MSDESRENASDKDRCRGRRRDRNHPGDEDDEEVEEKSERRGTENRRRQGGVESKRVPTKKKKEPRSIRQLRSLDVKDR